MRRLKEFLFPNGWERRRDWPRVCQALNRLHNYLIPGLFPMDGRFVSGWRPFLVQGGVGPDAGLDDLIVFILQRPPGSRSGPKVDSDAFALLGVESGPRFRAVIAGHSLIWKPGRTRRPPVGAPIGAGWNYSRDLTDYPILTSADRDRLAFGEGSHSIRCRSRSEKDAAWEELPGLVIAERAAVLPDGRVGWRIIPSEVVKEPEQRG